MHRTVIVPLDGSLFGECALGTAAGLASASGARLELLHVHQLTRYTFDLDPELDERLRIDEQHYLDRVRERVRRDHGVSATAVCLDGLPAATICERATSNDAPVIVMSTHGRTGLSRSWLGSVADDVVRHSTAPVLAVRPTDAEEGTPHGNGWPVRRILVPLDGSDGAATVLPHALWLAGVSGAAVLLLRIVEPVYAPVPTVPAPYSPSPLMRETLDTLMERSAVYLTEQATEIRRRHPGLLIDTEVDVAESPARLIIDRARERHADVVAMATHSRGLSRLVVRSVADKVLRGGPRLVMLVHAESD